MQPSTARLLRLVKTSNLLKSSAIKPCFTQLVRYDSHGHPPPGYKFPTMDDIPVPCGSWQEHYDNQQRKYNIQLLLGAGTFIITMAVGVYSGAFNLYLTPSKPSAPIE